MSLGKKVRLNRLFAHSSHHFFSVAIDHFIGYGDGMPDGLRQFKSTLAAILTGKPDAITMHIGMATSSWEPYAGKIPLILQSVIGRPDDTAFELIAGPEDAVRLGADALAVTAYVRGAREAEYLRTVAATVRQAACFDMPVIVHIYPRRFVNNQGVISFAPEDVAWAVRCGVETGVDVIKTPYCGDIDAFAQIVADSPVPVVAAGGPKQDTLSLALEMTYHVIQTGALGATVGRNVWGFPNIPAAISAFKAVVHDGCTPEEALVVAGL